MNSEDNLRQLAIKVDTVQTENQDGRDHAKDGMEDLQH